MPVTNLLQRPVFRLPATVVLAFFMLTGALGLAPTAQAETGATAPTVVEQAVASPADSATQPANSLEKNNLGGFFLIGAIINILFMAAFIYWAVREMRKSKRKKAGREQA